MPSPELWSRVKPFLEAARALPPDSRASFLSSISDADLRHEVERLLTAREDVAGILDPPGSDSENGSVSLTGRQIGPYQFGARIGAGGMGEVYRARDIRLDRTVAIKVLPPPVAQDTSARERFEREARAVAALSHPHICVLHDVGHEAGLDFLVMEHLRGETLAAALARGPLPVDLVVRYAIQLASALATAHDAGILHRDIKPSNVIVTADGYVKVLDFGLAKQTQFPQATATRSALTDAGKVVGTVAYMSPEQARGGIVDARTDLFSLGAVLYELATGRPAFPTPFDWRRPSAEGLPRALQPIVYKLLETDAERRHQTAAALVEDLTRLQQSEIAARTRPKRWLAFAGIFAAIAAIGSVFAFWLRPKPADTDQGQWVQLTRFPDSVSQPALSPDGRMITFVRGSTFYGPGEIYVKLLPDGEAVQLTRDGLDKASPAFSSDGSRIAYTVVRGNKWDTWVIPMPGGQPRPWLSNAAGLVWTGLNSTVLFAEIKNADMHMGIVMADEHRNALRDIYVPSGVRDMAHFASLSPDGKSVVIVEMVRGRWTPCRLVTLDGSLPSRQIGPPGAACTAAAWAPGGRWMYLGTNASGTFQISRQEFPGGRIEPVTSGPTEAEGIAMAADGRSLITAVSQRQSALVIRDSQGERQVSTEGFSFDPRFTPDGRKLLYRVLESGAVNTGPSSLRMLDVQSGRDEALLPDVKIVGPLALTYDISPDGREVAVATLDERNGSIWIMPLDRSSAPRRLPNVAGSRPTFGADGEIFFEVASDDGQWATAYGVRPDGSSLRKITDQPIIGIRGISSDREWLITRQREAQGTFMLAVPTRGGPATRLATGDLESYQWRWSTDGRQVLISGPGISTAAGRTFIVPLTRGRMFPDLPAGGLQSEEQIARLPGVRRIEIADVAQGPGELQAVSRLSVQRNLYRIPLR